MLSSCQQPASPDLEQQSPIPNELQQKLAHATNSSVDSAIYYSNLILDYIRDNKLPDSLFIHYNAIKAFQLVKTTSQDQALEPLLDNYLRASTLGDSSWLAKSALDLAEYYNIILQPSLALPYATLAADYYKTHGANLDAANSLSNLGWVHLDGGDLYQALDYFNMAENIYAANQDTLNLAFVLADIGYTLRELGLPEASLNATRRGIQLIESLPNVQNVGHALGNLAINYNETFPDSALYFQQKAVDLAIEMSDSLNWVASLFNLGNAYRHMTQFEETEKIYLQVYGFCKANGINQGIILSYNALGTLYLEMGKIANALRYATLADREFRTMGSALNVSVNLEVLISAHTQLGNQQQAQKLQGELDSLNNQMQLLQTQSTISYIEQAMKAERAAFGNQLLQQKNTAIATAVQRRTHGIVYLLLVLAISAVLGLRWKSDNQSAQQAIQVLLKRYAKEIQQKKLSRQSSGENSSYPQLAQKLRYLLEAEKIHLQPNLKTEDVLEYLQISYKDLNQLLKSEFQTTFPQLINQYRVSTAQQLLGNPQNQDISLDEIAALSGFGTRQSFYKVFQAQMGVSPGAFRAYLFEKG
jgi:AraC-like DNA-binding protein